MANDNPVLQKFTNETIRNVADRLAGLLPVPGAVLDAAAGQGLFEALGTKADVLLRAEPWTAEDYASVPLSAITDSDSGGRALLTNHHVIGVLRVLVSLKNMIAANPALGPLVGAVAVNPRA